MAGAQRLPPTGGRGRDGLEQTEPVDVSRPTSQLLDLSESGDETDPIRAPDRPSPQRTASPRAAQATCKRAVVANAPAVLGGLLFSTPRPRWLGFNRRQINDLHRRCLGIAQIPMDDMGGESA